MRSAVCAWGVAALLLAGCAIDLTGLGGAPDGEVGGRDAAAGDARASDDDGGGTVRDGGGEDRDARAGADASTPGEDGGPGTDAGAGRVRCPAADGDTLALYTFDGDEGTGVLTDVAGGHDGTRTAGSRRWRNGPSGCGRAIAFDDVAANLAYGTVPDSPDWDLAVGSVDFWARAARVPSGPDSAGLVSRDANGSARPGHLSVWIEAGGRLVLRLQNGEQAIYCTGAPVPLNRWFHVGINFGPPAVELWVDNVRASSSTPSDIDFAVGRMSYPCDLGTDVGIDGNANPWVFGVGTNRSAEGSATPTDLPFAGGALDHVRISSVRRSFARP